MPVVFGGPYAGNISKIECQDVACQLVSGRRDQRHCVSEEFKCPFLSSRRVY